MSRPPPRTPACNAKLGKIRRILLIQCSNFVQETPQILTSVVFNGTEGRQLRCRPNERSQSEKLKFAESKGFEPLEPVKVRQFSKLLLSTTQPTLHNYLIVCYHLHISRTFKF